ncbi:unnamed protein product [Absidia cylindrospora]
MAQQTPSLAPPSQLHYPSSLHFGDEEDIYESPSRYGELEETMHSDHMLDDYYTNSSPSTWSRLPRQSRQRRPLVVPPDYHYKNEDESYFCNDDSVPARTILFRKNATGGGHYFGPMISSPIPHQQIYKQPNRSAKKLYNSSVRYTDNNHYRRYSTNMDYADGSDEDDDDGGVLDPHNHRRMQQPTMYIGKKPPRRRHSLQHLQHTSPMINPPIMGPAPDPSPIRHHQQPVLQPLIHTAAQHPIPFYGQAPPNGPSMLPMQQPMIHAPPFLPYHPQLGYGAPMIPSTGSTTTPGTSMPFSPMMMMTAPSLLPPSITDTPNNNEIHPQTDNKATSTPNTTTTATAAAANLPPTDDAKSSQDSPNPNTSPTPATPSLSFSSSPPESATTEPKHSTNGGNSLVPLVRSLSLGESQSLDTKPRRRSLFESLFSLDGFKLSRNSSISSNNSNRDRNISGDTVNNEYKGSTLSPTTTSTSFSSSTSSSLSSSMIPVQELTAHTHTLTRKQSLSLEKKVKALSQRSYIWCYQIKPLPGQQQHHESRCWVAMKPKNQIKLDPYICYYHPSAMVKGARTDHLSTLVTLDKEPKLSGSFTVMPQAKIARVYPSMFSAANYIEVLIDCLPADGQFVVATSG